MTDHKSIGQYIIAYLKGEMHNEKESPELASWLERSDSNRKALRLYKKIWEESPYYMKEELFDTEAAWRRVHTVSRQKELLRTRLSNTCYILSGVAASVLVLVILSLSGVLRPDEDVIVHTSAPYGSFAGVTLPDGSSVRLNSGSEITYTYNRKKKIRKVDFYGEGFFEVAPDKAPFVICTPEGVQVKVLGTSFNLRDYADDPVIQASLVTGKIEMSHSFYGTLLLEPGRIAEYNKETHELKQVDGILEHTYGWLDNKLYMNHMSLKDVCRYLERKYDVQISIPGELGDRIHYMGALQEETITDVMNTLSELSEITYQIKGKQIRITSK